MRLDEIDDEAVDYMLDHIRDGHMGRLTLWEGGFIESIDDQWTRKRWLSEKQKEVLGRIWEKMP